MDPKDIGSDIQNKPVPEPDPVPEQDLPEEGATGEEMPEGGIRDEDDDLSGTPID